MTFDLDIRSVNVATAAVSLSLAAALLSIRATRRTSPGFGLWVVGAASLSAALVLLAVLGRGAPAGTVVLANLLVGLRAALVTAGLETFFGRRPRWALHAAGLAAVVAVSVAFGVLVPAVTVRIVAVTLIVASWPAWSAVLVAREAPRSLGAPSRFLVGGLALEVAWSLVRAADLAAGSDATNALAANAPWQAALFVAFSALAAAITFGLAALDMARLEVDLRASREELQVLRGIIPICAGCKKVRDGGTWTAVEAYVAARSGAEFSHGCCPDCLDRLYPDGA